MRTRRWQGGVGALAAGVVLAGPAVAGAASANAATMRSVADRTPSHERAAAARQALSGREHQRTLPDAGFDGMAVAAIGTGLTGTGWLLMLLGSRQLRRRSR